VHLRRLNYAQYNLPPSEYRAPTEHFQHKPKDIMTAAPSATTTSYYWCWLCWL